MSLRESIILAGGEGWRLKPKILIPKPMLKINKFTLLEHQISWLFRNGFQHIVIASRIRYNICYEEKHGVEFSIEKNKLGTGGAVKKALDYTSNKYVYIMNVDDIVRYRPVELYDKVDRGACLLAAKPRVGWGILELRQDLVIRFQEKPLMNNYVNAGHYVFDRSIISRYFPDKGNFESIVLPQLARERKLNAYRLTKENTWITINTYKDYLDVLSLKDKLFKY